MSNARSKQMRTNLEPSPAARMKDDLKSLPMPELENEAGVVARWSQSGRGAETADPIWA